MDAEKKKSNKHPWEKANPISSLFFAWVLPMFKKGYSQELTIEDLPAIPTVHKSEETVNLLSEAWDDEKLKSKKNGTSPRFWKALVKVHTVQLLIHLGVIIIEELIIRVMQPIYLRKLIHTFNEDSTASDKDQVIYATIVCLCSLFGSLAMHQCSFLMFRAGLSCRTASSSLIFRKAMELSHSASDQASVGHLMNLLSNDVSRYDFAMMYIPYIIVGPAQLIVLIYFLYMEMGVAALAGATFILIIMPTQVINGKVIAKFRASIAKQTDKRSSIMNEIIIAIRVIKMYAWEKPFSQLVKVIRKMEVEELWKRNCFRGYILSFYTFSAKFTAFLTIVTYVLLGNEITADKAFFSVAIYAMIVEGILFHFSIAISSVAEAYVSSSRIESFLLLEERSTILGNTTTDDKYGHHMSPGKISLDDVTATWSNTQTPTLKNLNATIEGDKVVMIVGTVGSGKTSFLNLLISELPILSGNVKCQGRISYASQEAWIFPGNIRENILFGEPFEKKHYHDVIEASALVDDFNELPNGDMSIVGERGITLSGGQKARVNLARALYRSANIYIMDDPLSAVDSRVSRHLFEKCIKSHLKGRLRILVTHQLQYLPQADWVILMNNGSFLDQGTYAELDGKGIDFGNILASENDIADPHKMSFTELEEEAKEVVKDYDKPEENTERSAEGSVSLKTYVGYFKSAKSPFGFAFVMLLFTFTQFLLTACEYWLSYWTDSEEGNHKAIAGDNKVVLYATMPSQELYQIPDPDQYLSQKVYLAVYAGLIGAVFIFTLTRAVGFFLFCLKISSNLHNSMFKSIVKAPAKFFDQNTSGRIMNRFTKDIGTIDELLPRVLLNSIDYFLQMMGVILVIVASNFYLTIPTIVILIIFWGLRVVYIQTSRDVQRLESISKSPVFTHLAASLQGLTTIRALRAQDKMIAQFDEKQDVHSATWFAFLSTSRCFILCIEMVGILFLTLVTFYFLLFAPDSTGGIVGLVITSTLTLATNIRWTIQQSAEAENYMVAVERALEYSTLTPETPLESTDEKKPPSDWPNKGLLQFQNLSLSYEDKDVLKDLTFDVKSCEKIGIVGRTGAGKSSIISALFRMTEPKGSILIDGIKINEIGLHDLRKNISIIPQDPVLFSGTIRYNLDPFNQFSDDELWTVLEEVQLKNTAPALDFIVSDGGSNFSVGQRQLMCLARAILRQNRIIVLDEATANVDQRTDEFIQKTIRTKFANCTIITIAHRIHTVMDCDRILVLHNGRIKEYDHPYLLLQNREGLLFNMASHTGEAGIENLRKIAEQHYEKNVKF